MLLVLTHLNAARLPYGSVTPRPAVEPASGEQLRVLQSPEIHFNGQPIGVVVADSQARAEHAASLVRVDYEHGHAQTRFDPAAADPVSEAAAKLGRGPLTVAGDPDIAFATAAVRVEQQLQPATGTPQRDGTPRHHRRLGPGPAHPVEQNPMGRQRTRHDRRDLRHPDGQRPGHQPLHRRRVRVRPTHLAPRHPRRPGCPPRRAPGAVRADPPATVHLNRFPAAHRTACRPRRRPRRAPAGPHPGRRRAELHLRGVRGGHVGRRAVNV